MTGADPNIPVTIDGVQRYFHVFEAVDEDGTRAEAVTRCVGDNSWLATVESDDALTELLTGLDGVATTDLWIGLHKVSEWRLANGNHN